MYDLTDYLQTYPALHTTLYLSALLLASWLSNFIMKHIILRGIRRLVGKLQNVNNQDAIDFPIAARLANIVPISVISLFIVHVPNLPETAIRITQNVCSALILLTIALALIHILDYINISYLRKNQQSKVSIKGYIQLGKLLIYLVTAILIISSLIDRNPLILLSGLGAMAAVLMLIFQDTILSLVASVQINASGSVRVGDWIELPQLNADGDVIDIALHTVTVQNWDKTYTVFPTKRLVTDAFKNWRGMTEAGGRRIKRSVFIDQNSVRFLNDDDIKHLKQFSLLEDYLCNKEKELDEWNKEKVVVTNKRRLTNLGTFRAYLEAYLRSNPNISQKFSLMVRQLQPGEFGLPLEIYCFSNNTAWVAYEGIQSDIFDHLLAIMPEFDLRVFQQPSGSDFMRILPKA